MNLGGLNTRQRSVDASHHRLRHRSSSHLGEAILDLAFRAGIQDTVLVVHLFCLHPLSEVSKGPQVSPAWPCASGSPPAARAGSGLARACAGSTRRSSGASGISAATGSTAPEPG